MRGAKRETAHLPEEHFVFVIALTDKEIKSLDKRFAARYNNQVPQEGRNADVLELVDWPA